MLSSVNSLSSATALSLLGANNPANLANTQPSTAQKLLRDVTGNTDDTFKAGKAIGAATIYRIRDKGDRNSGRCPPCLSNTILPAVIASAR